jgi:hypothetical protein
MGTTDILEIDRTLRWLKTQITHRVANATFCCTFHHDGKFSPAWWEWECFTISTITYKVVVYDPAERADTLPLFLLYPYMYSVVKIRWARRQGTYQESVLQLSRVSFGGHWLRLLPFQAPKKSRFQGPPLPIALVMDIARIKIITSRAI